MALMIDSEAHIIDGRELARAVREDVRTRVDRLREAGRTVRLDAILVGEEGAASLYARNQARTCEEAGIEYRLHELPAAADEAAIAAHIERLNADADVRAIMLHLPLPEGIDTERIQALIAPPKDVEGVNPANIGNVVYGRRLHVPCTALAVLEIIESTGVPLPGAHCVCVGASNIVGKPVVVLLMAAEATVISTNIHTRGIQDLTRQADVLVSAAGVPGLVTADWIKPGAVVIDVGINRVKGDDDRMHTVGDVDFESVRRVAGHLTPVPGGVGPMTVAMMLRNTVASAEREHG